MKKNGTVVEPSRSTSTAGSNRPANIVVFWQEDMVDGDYIEFAVRNNTDSQPLVFASIKIRCN